MTVLPVICTPETVLSEEIDPIEIPCPPEQVLSLKTIVDPLLIAKQSSWFLTVHPVIVYARRES